MMRQTLSFIIFLIALATQFSSSMAVYNSNRRNSWVFWDDDDGHRRCANICIIVFVLIAVLLVSICACGIYLCLRSSRKHKKKDEENRPKKEREEAAINENKRNSMGDVYQS